DRSRTVDGDLDPSDAGGESHHPDQAVADPTNAGSLVQEFDPTPLGSAHLVRGRHRHERALPLRCGDGLGFGHAPSSWMNSGLTSAMMRRAGLISTVSSSYAARGWANLQRTRIIVPPATPGRRLADTTWVRPGIAGSSAMRCSISWSESSESASQPPYASSSA